MTQSVRTHLGVVAQARDLQAESPPMAARTGGLALLGLLMVGLVMGSRTLSSPDAMLGFVGSNNKIMQAGLVGLFAVAASIGVRSRSVLLRIVGGLVLMGCMSFGVMLWSSWNTPEIADTLAMMEDIDTQFAQVAAALEGVEGNLTAQAGGLTAQAGGARLLAQPAIDDLVASGYVLVGRECEVNALGMGREQLAYVSGDAEPELVQLTIEVTRRGRGLLLDRTRTTGESPLLPFEPACV